MRKAKHRVQRVNSTGENQNWQRNGENRKQEVKDFVAVASLKMPTVAL